jgi:hypothetical protein
MQLADTWFSLFGLVFGIASSLVSTGSQGFCERVLNRHAYALAHMQAHLQHCYIAMLQIRIVLAIPVSLLTFARCDMTPMPDELAAVFDGAYMTYVSVFMQQSACTHPVAIAFAAMLLHTVRSRAAAPASMQSPLLRHAPEATMAHRRVDNDSSGGGDDVEEGNFTSSPLQKLQTARLAAATGGLGSSPTSRTSRSAVSIEAGAPRDWGAHNSPHLQEQHKRQRQPSAGSYLAGQTLASVRARSRWHLAVLLTLNPSLRAYRVRDSYASAVAAAISADFH